MCYIYILKLRSNKYYVGRTNNIERRVNDHFNGKASMFTSLYKPIEIVNIINNCDKYDEDKYVFIYMDKYGIDNVRGGSFCKILLSTYEISVLSKVINNKSDNCFNCNSHDHFISNCYYNKIDDLVLIETKNNILNNLMSIKTINDYVDVLIHVDHELFKNIFYKRILKLIDMINKKNYKNIQIDIDNINFKVLTYGLILLIDESC